MLIKEYRIPLPLTVEEYRIAQLYMISKKSRQESSGSVSGVEILVNEPYTDGPGGSGQFTHKIYHIGSHLPGWFKSLLPKSALFVEEKAWNAYPYTKTVFKCPFVEKFYLEIETYYTADVGILDNVFNLSESEKRNRVVDIIDFVNDINSDLLDPEKENPLNYVSEKTGRGPMERNWREIYWNDCKNYSEHPTPSGRSIMCAYKLCKVEFRYWGMQSKIERFIHDTGLRDVMLTAHLQAWIWQDEWVELSMEDIRSFEFETAELLKKKMHSNEFLIRDESSPHKKVSERNHEMRVNFNSIEYNEQEIPEVLERLSGRSSTTLILPESHGCTESDDEFFDCAEDTDNGSLARWSSLDGIHSFDENSIPEYLTEEPQISLRRVQSLRVESRPEFENETQKLFCSTTFLIFIAHGGSVLDVVNDPTVRKSELTTFRGVFESIIRTHYPSLAGHVVIKTIPTTPICTETLSLLSSLSPYSFDVNIDTTRCGGVSNDRLPVGTIPLFATLSPNYESSIDQFIESSNAMYKDFIHSEKGSGFSKQVVFIGDSIGSILLYDALCRPFKRTDSESSMMESTEENVFRHLNDDVKSSFDFEISDFFSFGSPLGLLLAYRKILQSQNGSIYRLTRPSVHQVYNLFHASDPIASRIEPLLLPQSSLFPPINVPRYVNYPRGDNTSDSFLEFLQSNSHLLLSETSLTSSRSATPGRVSRRVSEDSILSGSYESQINSALNGLRQKWWGDRRIDYALYCPEGLTNFPTNSLPHLFHASYWESNDVISFILRQLIRGNASDSTLYHLDTNTLNVFTPNQPREKWIKKRTSVKIRNGASNHRANDVLVKEGLEQTITARFTYGPLDMSALTGEKVDIHIMKDPPAGDWILLDTVLTDKNGKISYSLKSPVMSYGIYPIRMLVRGDHSMLHSYLAIVPPLTEVIVFSIDGSFAGSMSVSGKDPKVQPCSVDIVRHWQELGYLILYVTGRPDMQLQRVVTWLSQHNFPIGLVSFRDGFTTDPLRHKLNYLKSLVVTHEVRIHKAYGSSKDVQTYAQLGLSKSDIYVIGKLSKKQNSFVTWLSEGYAIHLEELKAHGGSRPATGNARMVIHKSYFGPPGQKSGGLCRSRTLACRAKRTISYPIASSTLDN